MKEILEIFNVLKGQFVITASWKIERLVAVGSDEHDYYWVTYNGRVFTWNTCVGRIMPLKGHLQDKDYDELVRLARLNHFDQATLWGKDEVEGAIVANKHKNDLMKLEGSDQILTEVCWEMKNTWED